MMNIGTMEIFTMFTSWTQNDKLLVKVYHKILVKNSDMLNSDMSNNNQNNTVMNGCWVSKINLIVAFKQTMFIIKTKCQPTFLLAVWQVCAL